MESFEAILDKSSDPAALVSPDGELLWSNQSYDALSKLCQASNLSELLGQENLSELLNCLHFKANEVELKIKDSNSIPQTAIAVALNQGNPDLEKILLLFKSLQVKLKRLKSIKKCYLLQRMTLKIPWSSFWLCRSLIRHPNWSRSF